MAIGYKGKKMNYLKESEKTENKDFSGIHSRLGKQKVLQLLHAALGMSGESGEFVDSVKKHIFYGSEIDQINLKEELGDILWYIALACRALGTNIEELQTLNIEKLSKRYPDKFSKEKAENRDIENELSHFGENK